MSSIVRLKHLSLIRTKSCSCLYHTVSFHLCFILTNRRTHINSIHLTNMRCFVQFLLAIVIILLLFCCCFIFFFFAFVPWLFLVLLSFVQPTVFIYSLPVTFFLILSLVFISFCFILHFAPYVCWLKCRRRLLFALFVLN